MKTEIKDLESYHQHNIIAECPECGDKYSFYTQRDDCPEYYTDVWVVCKNCRNLIKCIFPVN